MHKNVASVHSCIYIIMLSYVCPFGAIIHLTFFGMAYPFINGRALLKREAVVKILVCDDSVVNRQILGAYLKQMGHTAIYADNGAQAVERFADEKPDMVLIDVEMPEMDGYEATKLMRQACVDFSQWTPIIFISSYVDDQSIVKGIDAGGDDYLTKPVSQAVLRAKIHAMRRLVTMRENLIDFGNQLREVNEKLLVSNQLLSELSLKDPLTRLANRRAFEENLLSTCRTAIRKKKPVSLLMIDVDNFKLFNDTYGHQAGDACLQQVAQVLRKGMHRATDFVARFGGEEFAVILLETELSGALHVAERLRMGVEVLQMESKNAPSGIVSISVGACCTKAEKEFNPDLLVATADAALYSAKQSGRNCIIGVQMELDKHQEEQAVSYKAYQHMSPTGSHSKH